jgi:tRNA threonylcarbamoyladenosine biosynthesis protein TsaB
VILAIDTSTDVATVALQAEGELLAELSWSARGNHSLRLMNAIQAVLSTQGTDPGDLTAVVTAIGPGSFSGIRVGVAAAKGLAMSRGIPLAGIPTLDAIGLQASGLSSVVWAVIPAGRRQVYAARYTGRGPAWKRVSEYLLTGADDIATALAEGDMIAGAATSEVEAPPRMVCPSLWNVPRGGFLAELGRRYFEAGGEDRVYTLEPLYLRPSAAEEKRAHQE